MNPMTTAVTALSATLQTTGFVHIPRLCPYLPDADSQEAVFNTHWDDLVLDENYKSYTTATAVSCATGMSTPASFVSTKTMCSRRR